MEILSRSATSGLNPDAPLFVPWAYRAVEDFSQEWWDLIQSTAWFRDYWLEERFDEEVGGEQEMKEVGDIVDLDDELAVLDEEEAFLVDMATDLSDLKGANGKENDCREVVSLAGLKWKESQNGAEKVKKVVAEKAPKNREREAEPSRDPSAPVKQGNQPSVSLPVTDDASSPPPLSRKLGEGAFCFLCILSLFG